MSVLEKFDQDLRIGISYPGLRKQLSHGVTRFLREAGSGYQQLVHLDEACPDAAAAVAAQVAELAPLGRSLTWKIWSHDANAPALRQALAANGFEPDGDAYPVHVAELATLDPGPSRGHELRPVRSPSDVESVAALLSEVYGGADFSWLPPRLNPHLEIPGYLSAYLAYLEGRPVSVAWVYFHANSRFATLHGGATLPEARGRHVYSELLRTRVLEARDRGYEYLIVEPSDYSRPLLERRGFTRLTLAEDHVLTV